MDLRSPENVQKGERKLRRRLLAAFVLVGILLGVMLGASGALLLFKGYVASPKFWADLTRLSQSKFSADQTEVTLFPPVLKAKKMKSLASGGKGFHAEVLRVELVPTSLIRLSPTLIVRADGVTLFKRANASVPLPLFPVDARLVLKSFWATPTVEVQELRALGMWAHGQLRVHQRRISAFELFLPKEKSLLTGEIKGAANDTFRISGRLGLPNSVVGVPAEVDSLFGASGAHLGGRVLLSGEGEFLFENESWQANARWEIDLSQAAFRYKDVNKTQGHAAKFSGRFRGNDQEWKVQDATLTLGQARIVLDLESVVGKHVHLIGEAPEFELSEVLALTRTEAARSRSSGRASLKMDLRLPHSRPARASGMIHLVVNQGQIDPLLYSWILPEGIGLSGVMQLKGLIRARLADGMFREAELRMRADLRENTVELTEYGLNKPAGVPLLASLSGRGSGNNVVLNSVRLAGAGGLRAVLKGSVSELDRPVVNLELVGARLPLAHVSAFMSEMSGASGLAQVNGQFRGNVNSPEGLFTKLNWKLSDASVRYGTHHIEHANGQLETVSGPGGFLLRIGKLSGSWSTSPFELHGKYNRTGKVLKGEFALTLDHLSMAQLSMPAFLTSEKVDFSSSELLINASLGQFESTDFKLSDARATVRIGAAGDHNAPPFVVTIEDAKEFGYKAQGYLSPEGALKIEHWKPK